MKTLTTALLAIAILVGGQNADAAGCKYQVNSTDKFTKVLTQRTKWNALMHGFSVSLRAHSPFISVFSIDGEAELQLKIETFIQQKEEPGIIELEDIIYVLEGAPLLVMMEDGSITTLLAKTEVRNDAYVPAPEDKSIDTDLYWIKATTVITYALDADIMKALTSQPATKIRVIMANDNLDLEIHKGSIEDFKMAVQCVS
jgi:hypothetical protein